MKKLDDPLARRSRSASIDQSCVGCGNCGEVADAAVLCPSFYRADIISNPTGWDRVLARICATVIGCLQRRRAATAAGVRAQAHDASVVPAAIARERPITIAILAIGGQGGGVLTDWMIALAERNGWYAQATSVRRRRPAHRRHDLLPRDDPGRGGPDAGAVADAGAGRCRHRHRAPN